MVDATCPKKGEESLEPSCERLGGLLMKVNEGMMILNPPGRPAPKQMTTFRDTEPTAFAIALDKSAVERVESLLADKLERDAEEEKAAAQSAEEKETQARGRAEKQAEEKAAIERRKEATNQRAAASKDKKNEKEGQESRRYNLLLALVRNASMDEQEVDEEEEDMVSYVQCTTSTCSRWRLVPKAMADRYEEDENFVCDIIEDCGCDDPCAWCEDYGTWCGQDEPDQGCVLNNPVPTDVSRLSDSSDEERA